MKEPYSFWKLLRAQWSWNNDKYGLMFTSVISLVVSTVTFYTGDITYAETGLPVEHWSLIGSGTWLLLFISHVLYLEVLWHSLKLIVMSILCGLLVYGLKNNKWEGEDFYKMHKTYLEMITWRQ